MSKGYFKEVLSIVQSVLILAKIFGYSHLSWPRTLFPTVLYIMLWLLAGMIVAANKKILEDERSVSATNGRNVGTTSVNGVNEFTDDGK